VWCVATRIDRYYQEGRYVSPWLNNIIRILNESGMGNIWQNQMFPNSLWLSSSIKQRTQDQFRQTWFQTVNQSSKCKNYRIFKTQHSFEKYLVELPFKYRKCMLKLRTANHKLPVERGRYYNVPLSDRHCELCDLNILCDFILF
jgi:hypothetical protein